MDCLKQVKEFTQFNLISTYYRMRIWEGEKWKTTFRIRYNHFKYLIMLFGLSNTLASFQSYINKILAGKLDIFIVVYLDNILIYTKNLGQL